MLKQQYRAYYTDKTIQSFPYQAVLFSHESFGSNIRYGLDLNTKKTLSISNTGSGSGRKLLKIFNEDIEEWVNNCYQIADKYYEASIDFDDDWTEKQNKSTDNYLPMICIIFTIMYILFSLKLSL